MGRRKEEIDRKRKRQRQREREIERQREREKERERERVIDREKTYLGYETVHVKLVTTWE